MHRRQVDFGAVVLCSIWNMGFDMINHDTKYFFQIVTVFWGNGFLKNWNFGISFRWSVKRNQKFCILYQKMCKCCSIKCFSTTTFALFSINQIKINQNYESFKNIHLYKGKVEIEYNVFRLLAVMKDHFLSFFLCCGTQVCYFSMEEIRLILVLNKTP